MVLWASRSWTMKRKRKMEVKNNKDSGKHFGTSVGCLPGRDRRKEHQRTWDSVGRLTARPVPDC